METVTAASTKYSTLDQEEEEEEALSLCDLPINEENCRNQENQESISSHNQTTQEDEFDFGPPWGGGSRDLSPMRAADDLFFQGRILPLRFSVSSECGLDQNRFMTQDGLNHVSARFVSRSKSMDHVGSLSRITNATRATKPRVLNNFHSFPSPKPQIRLSTANSRVNTANYRARKSVASSSPSSSIWDFLRIGLVRTPGIDLHDLNKVRPSSCSSAGNTTVSRNSSSNSSSNNSSSTVKSFSSGTTVIGCDGGSKSRVVGKSREKQRKQGFSLSGCSCTVNAVKAVQIKNNKIVTRSHRDDHHRKSCVEEKPKESKLKRSKTEKMKLMMMQEKQALLGKQDMSRRRTFEWIKELSSHETRQLLEHEREA